MISKTLKISVVTVSYNAAATIEATILSVLDQTYDNIEYLLIDGGSTDGTVDIIRRYSEDIHNGHRIAYWVSESDHGIYDAMNKGISAATGDYIYFIGSDDTLLDKNVFKEVVSWMKAGYNTIYYGDVIFQPEGRKYCGKFSKWDLIRRNICHQAIFYPSLILKKYPFKLEYKAYSDYYENILFMGLGIKFEYIPVIVCNFTIGGFSIAGDEKFMADRGNIIATNLGKLASLYFNIRVKYIPMIWDMITSNKKV